MTENGVQIQTVIYSADAPKKSRHIMLQNGKRCIQIFKNTNNGIIFFDGSFCSVQCLLRIEWAANVKRMQNERKIEALMMRECKNHHKKVQLNRWILTKAFNKWRFIRAAWFMTTKEESLTSMIADPFTANTLIVHALRIACQYTCLEIFFQPLRVRQW